MASSLSLKPVSCHPCGFAVLMYLLHSVAALCNECISITCCRMLDAVHFAQHMALNVVSVPGSQEMSSDVRCEMCQNVCRSHWTCTIGFVSVRMH